MKQLIKKNISLITAVLLLSISCTKTIVIEGEQPGIEDYNRTFIEYRVVRDSLKQPYKISYRDKSGDFSKIDTIQSKNYRIIIGPVKNGFIAEISDIYDCTLIISIKPPHESFKCVSSGKKNIKYIIE